MADGKAEWLAELAAWRKQYGESYGSLEKGISAAQDLFALYRRVNDATSTTASGHPHFRPLAFEAIESQIRATLTDFHAPGGRPPLSMEYPIFNTRLAMAAALLEHLLNDIT
jgi:hypothetical protein